MPIKLFFIVLMSNSLLSSIACYSEHVIYNSIITSKKTLGYSKDSLQRSLMICQRFNNSDFSSVALKIYM